MSQIEHKVCSAYPIEPGGFGSDIVLFLTGQQVNSITTSINLALDIDGNIYFLKPIVSHQDREPVQLAYLHSVGITVPHPVLVDRSSSFMATPFSGNTFSSVVASLEPMEAAQLVFQAGSLLRRVHQALDSYPPEEAAISNGFGSTAHIVDNFYYKHVGVVDLREYVNYRDPLSRAKFTKPSTSVDNTDLIDRYIHKPFIPVAESGPSELKRLLGCANELATSFLDRLKPYINPLYTEEGLLKPFLGFGGGQLFEGDYKPDNLLVRGNGSEMRIAIIDPVISRGVTGFDLAKFSGRFILGKYSTHTQDLLLSFFEGYGQNPVDRLFVYGPLSFVDLLRMDILNVLRSYAKRYFQGDKRYSLIGALDSEEFCLRTINLICSESMN